MMQMLPIAGWLFVAVLALLVLCDAVKSVDSGNKQDWVLIMVGVALLLAAISQITTLYYELMGDRLL